MDGSYFYNQDEKELYRKKMDQINIMNAIEKFTLYSSLEDNIKTKKYKFNSYNEIKFIYELKYNKDFSEEERKLYNNKKYIKRYFTGLEKKYFNKLEKIKNELKNSNDNYIKANKEKEIINKILNDKINENTSIRKLDNDRISKYDIVSIFDSNLTRVMELEFNKLSKNLLIVEISQFKIMEQLIERGFDWINENGESEHYVFFTSSAGQIRKQKIVMINENIKNNLIDIFTCGLTLEIINKKGGVNVNKYLAYLALNDSATDVWEDFNIDECIVIKDFETTVSDTVDYIGAIDVEKEFYKLDKNGNKVKNEDKFIKETRIVKALTNVKREIHDVKISHSDGCGWILPSKSKINFMCRLPWVKGLLTPCDYITWCDKFNNGNCKVVDIYGKEWDLKKDNIKIVFTESQFKMWKYYSNITDNNGNVIKYGWDIYKDNFKGKNGWDINCENIIRKPCIANKCNEEPKSVKEFKKAKFNYQMLQTLVNMTEDELKIFTEPVSKLVTKAYTDRETQLKLLGASKTNKNLTNFQKALMLYPALLKDNHVKEELSDKITSIKNMARIGRFAIDGIYTFLIPDIFAWMQYIFLGKDKVTGLLNRGEVYCDIYKEESKLLVNRSPHLYKEHGVRKNKTGVKTYNKQEIKLSDWFTTHGVYTSCNDLISKLLQFDVDGDKALVTKGSLVDIAEREMEGIVPLFYEMSKAPAEPITNNSIIKSLKSAFRFGNIGKYSNKLTKIWNSKEKDVETAKMLTALNNFYIDGAKTNYCPEVYSDVKNQLNQFKTQLKIDMIEEVNKLKEIHKVKKIEILSSIEDKDEKIKKQIELNEICKKEIFELKAKLTQNNNMNINDKEEEILKNDMNYKIKISDKSKLPYFFIYAKNMNPNKVELINNSTVNKACKLIDEIPQLNYNFGKDRFNWRYLTNNSSIDITTDKALMIIEQYEILNNQIKSYFARGKEEIEDEEMKKITIANRVYSMIRRDFENFIKDLNTDIVEATDIIVSYIYNKKKTSKKAFLFDVLGDIILINIEKNKKESDKNKCEICGKRINKSSSQKYCSECWKKIRQEQNREKALKYYHKSKKTLPL